MTATTAYLHLSEREVVSTGVTAPAQVTALCEEVFHLLARGDYLMGGPHGDSHGLGLDFPESSPFPGMPLAGPDRRFVTMPAYLGGRFDVCGNKWYGSNHANAAAGLPRSVLTLMLNDKSTGEPLCLMSANAISAARTGAVPAVAAQHLAPEARTLAVVGCGVIGRAALVALLHRLPLVREVRFFDVVEAQARNLAHDPALTGTTVVVCTSAAQCVDGADVVSVAASRSHPLHLPAAAFSPTATILLSGPLTGDDDLWRTSTVVLDHVGLHEEYVREASVAPDPERRLSGQIGGPLYRLAARGEVAPLADLTDLPGLVSGSVPMPDDRGRRVVVASGMAVLDVAVGHEAWTRARASGTGTPLDLWG
ncbi:ornithine cyclodeaminase [Cellulomonas sp. H30R-01]|uniref:ornithine cyclodeaminase n=1 Tax=Cellulomonas sp. H30R-01 TaxID=2704467 RepID=UPI00138DAC63|nr:ornithine cyclodeaminase [Cellulomonas sp. H30R-01]QHT57562.1 ornithine cyclodeaminase [Cellulomonas sp. H30R-01]